MKQENIKSIAIIGIIVLFSLGSTYAFLNFSAANNTATGVGGCFKVNYSGQAINNLSIQSTSTYTEGANSDVILSKATDCKIYTEADIYIHTNTTTTAPISDGALKYKVVNGTKAVGEGSIKTTGDTKLATVTLTNTATTYKVYLWIDSETSNGKYNETTYSGYIFASAVQSSTVKGT